MRHFISFLREDDGGVPVGRPRQRKKSSGEKNKPYWKQESEGTGCLRGDKTGWLCSRERLEGGTCAFRKWGTARTQKLNVEIPHSKTTAILGQGKAQKGSLSCWRLPMHT